MRAAICTFSPLLLFWCAIYVLALLSIYTIGILACTLAAKQSPAQSIRSKPEA
jgi:hypothetical protein